MSAPTIDRPLVQQVDPVVQSVDAPKTERHIPCPVCWGNHETHRVTPPAIALCSAPISEVQSESLPKCKRCFRCQECRTCGTWVCLCNWPIIVTDKL